MHRCVSLICQDILCCPIRKQRFRLRHLVGCALGNSHLYRVASESTSACILLLKTPQLRPRPPASRPRLPFLRARSVLMSTHNRGVQHQLFNVCCYGKQPENQLPYAFQSPPTKTPPDAVPLPKTLG